jgi:hypothetical protein
MGLADEAPGLFVGMIFHSERRVCPLIQACPRFNERTGQNSLPVIIGTATANRDEAAGS